MTLDLRLAAAADATQVAQDFVLANARLVLPDRVLRGLLAVEGGRIVALEEGDRVPAGAVDCRGDLVAPGFVELHTDNLEWHIQPRPKVDWPHASAILAHDAELASSGITTVFDALRVGVIVAGGLYDDRIYARALASEILALRAAGALRIDHRLHLRAEVCSDTLGQELSAFGLRDGVGIVSLMDHTPGERQFRDLEKLRAYASRKPTYTEAGFVTEVGMQKALRERVGATHEALVVAEARRLGAVLASHDDTDRGHVEESAARGARLAEFPTTLEAARACREHGIAVMMGAPNLIRGGSHSGNVAAAELAREGLLDVVSSDYVPSALLASAFALAQLWKGDLARAWDCVSGAPARAAGLLDRGRIEADARADLLRVGEAAGHPVLRGVWSGGLRVA